MTEKTPKFSRSPSTVAGDSRRPPHPSSSSPLRRNIPPLRRPNRRKPSRTLSRSSSEPILWAVPAIAGERGGLSWTGSMRVRRPHTCADAMSPSRWPKSPPAVMGDYSGEVAAKVVVSVCVEGSPGPVQAMVRLEASVEEAIAIVVDNYRRQGRSPRLDHRPLAAFHLHHSHFSLHSLNKRDKIGEIGGRNFYLRTKTSDNGLWSEVNEIHQARERCNSSVSSYHPFFTTIARNFNKIERRTKKIFKMVICFFCD